MRLNLIVSVASEGPFYWSGPTTDDPPPARMKTAPEHHGQTAEGTHGRPPTLSLSAQAFDVLLTAELEELRRRRRLGLNQTRSYARRHGAAQESDVSRKLLAEVEQLAGELTRKVAHIAVACAAQLSNGGSARANAAAVAWMWEALEDIAATALGMERGSREELLRASQAEFRAGAARDQDPIEARTRI